MKIYYSLNSQGFYPEEMFDDYKAAGSLPDDLNEISQKKYEAFFNPPEGYGAVFDEKGPRITKLPGIDHIAVAENQRQIRLAEIGPATSTLQTKLLMGRKLTAEESSKLNSWMDYSDQLNELDISGAPEISWPDKPQEKSPH
ncbi:tail fiber assembly protein [Pantoea brenneri]|uniref:tail fiber assembly protein n=1 Tax=Pantoea brenneri TaxID=472694 RepID=UPI00289F14AF|nr:tail fiber assembly protein [Pantoea brenneri]